MASRDTSRSVADHSTIQAARKPKPGRSAGDDDSTCWAIEQQLLSASPCTESVPFASRRNVGSCEAAFDIDLTGLVAGA